MKHCARKFSLCWLILLVLFSGCNSKAAEDAGGDVVLFVTDNSQLTYVLPSPETEGSMSLEEALESRRSRRNFQDKELSAEQLSQILWAAYGITDPESDNPSLRGGRRTAPSAGALYPLEIYVVVGNVTGIQAGVYKYVSEGHKIIRTIDNDIREDLSAASLDQAMIRDAPVIVLYCAVFSRIADRYGERGRERYAYIEIGHSAQNIYLQAEALGLGTCAIGAFTDSSVIDLLGLPDEEVPLYLMPVGFIS